MNKARKQRIREALAILESAKPVLEEIRDEEENAFDNLPESIQESDRGDEMQEYVYALENACDGIDVAIDSLNEVL